MKLYKLYNLTVYVNEEKGTVHHAVDFSNKNPVTLYPYEKSRYGGLDNCCDCYTLKQVRDRYTRGTLQFR